MKRSSKVVIVVVVVVLAAAAFWLFAPRKSLPENLMSAVPADAYAVARVRVDRVMASDAFKRLVVERGQAEGMQRVEKTCGFNPLSRLRELVVFARPSPEGGLPRLAFVARGDLQHEELIRCVEKVTGASRDKLRTEEIEGVITVASSKGNSRAAFVGRDGIVGGDSETVRAVIHVIVGKAEPVLSDPLLSGLFAEVEQGRDVAGVARIPEEARPQLRVLAARMFGGVLAPFAEVRALAGNLHLAEAKITAGGTMLAKDAAQAEGLVSIVRAQLERFLRIPGVSLTPAGGVLRSVKSEAQGDRATFAAEVRVSTVEALLELLPAIEKLQKSLMPDEAQAPAASPTTKAEDAGVAQQPKREAPTP